ncbi:hypothetical protein JMA_18590 [Jeotgalibacillus malaysiensis]|uniref:Uncharacterized protein n=1 Tax=Jeotgalibacillus malaysiensis TaxID=1508404 RepID=A0A0B5AM03_9BACL|nr:hypothetical protein JMA_18590 [Jeotgalibacillus malaysiensis]
MNEWSFDTKQEAFDRYEEIMRENFSKYEHVRVKRGTQAAFWNEEEYFFCDDCDEDLQVFHGFILFSEEKPYIREKMTDTEKAFFENMFTEKKEA